MEKESRKSEGQRNMERLYFYGVDSLLPADKFISVPGAMNPLGGALSQRLFDFVRCRLEVEKYYKDIWGRMPNFWARYLNNYNFKDGTPRHLTAAEASFISGRRGCRILPIYNGPHRRQADLVGANAYENGVSAANAAVSIASNIGVSHSTVIYADIERWAVSADWYQGWCATIYRSSYAAMGGIYGNAAVPATTQHLAAGIGAAIAELTENGDINHAKRCYVQFWSNRARNGRYLNSVSASTFIGSDLDDEKVFPTSFEPATPPSSRFVGTNVFQYAAQYTLGHSKALVDLNICKAEAFRTMWAP